MQRSVACILCGKICQMDVDGSRDVNHYECMTCGEFATTHNTERDFLDRLTDQAKRKLSACTREYTIHEKQEICLCSSPKIMIPNTSSYKFSDVLENLYPSKIQDRFDRTLANLCKLSKYPGMSIIFEEYDFLPITFAEEPDAALFVLNELRRRDLIEMPEWRIIQRLSLKVTGAGIERIQHLEDENGRNDSNQAFVAMWFESSLQGIYIDAIEPAIRDCGFDPLRIDGLEFNDKICDEIIAQIRKSKFVIADFTGQRGGVYFESGFAMGLGMPVIWMCREDDMDHLHFDTNHYNHICWSNADDLKERLANRIRATIAGARL